jgi:hypothetical protein
MSKLRNDSYFYYEHEGQKWGITFAQLWINWEKKFDKAYNIANATIVAKMKAAASLRTALPAVDDARDVKLD